MIEVVESRSSDPPEYEVRVRAGGGETSHRVTLTRADWERLTGGTCPPKRCVEAAFRFLLDREPKEAILAQFDLSAISRYFPEFEGELPRYIRTM